MGYMKTRQQEALGLGNQKPAARGSPNPSPFSFLPLRKPARGGQDSAFSHPVRRKSKAVRLVKALRPGATPSLPREQRDCACSACSKAQPAGSQLPSPEFLEVPTRLLLQVRCRRAQVHPEVREGGLDEFGGDGLSLQLLVGCVAVAAPERVEVVTALGPFDPEDVDGGHSVRVLL